MTLTLRAVSLNDQPLTQPITAYFNGEGGSVGRGDHNTLALPDPERHISRQQAEISVTGNAYRIKNVGSSNPITVRGQTLGRGDSAQLAHRDQVRIGGYLLEVVQEDLPDSAADTVVRGRAAVDAATPGAVRGGAGPRAMGSVAGGTAAAGETGTPLSLDNPFAALLGDPMPDPSPPGAPAVSVAWGPAAAAPSQGLLPDDFDPFAVPVAPSPPATRPEGVFGDLVPNAEPSSLDEAFGLHGDAGDPLARFLSDAPRSQAADAGISADPLAMFRSARPAPPDPAPTAGDRVSDLRSSFTPPRPVAPDRATPPREAGPSDALPGRELWAAFCEGADAPGASGLVPTPETMRTIGALLRSAVDGTLQLMSVRATAKHELRAEVTVIQSRNNNPLKFSPDAGAALEQMLRPPLRGFLAGPAAMTDAMHDLVGHAIGTMAGTRAALDGVLDRFAPRQLEAKLSAKSMLDSLLPMNRKAKLWELYLRHFDAIRDEAQDDFHSLFGRAFLAAYEQQLDRLKREQSGRA